MTITQPFALNGCVDMLNLECSVLRGLPVTCAVHLGHPVDTKRFGASGCIYSHLQFLVYYYYYIVLCLWCDAMKKLPSYKIYGVHGSARSPYLTEVTTCDQLRSSFIHATRILSYSVWGVVHNRRNTENKLFARSLQHCRTWGTCCSVWGYAVSYLYETWATAAAHT